MTLATLDFFWQNPQLTQSYWHGNAKYQAEYEKWHNRLGVPYQGKADTMNGQILRSFDLINIQLFKSKDDDLATLSEDKFEINTNNLFNDALIFIENNVPEARDICIEISQAYQASRFITLDNHEEYAQRLNKLGDIIMEHLIAHA